MGIKAGSQYTLRCIESARHDAQIELDSCVLSGYVETYHHAMFTIMQLIATALRHIVNPPLKKLLDYMYLQIQ